MKESMTSRVGRIISGSFNALLDAVESSAPEAVMEQSLREIDAAIEEVRHELGKVIASKHMATSRLKQVNDKCEELNNKIELAVAEKRDDLAEVAISKQLDMEAQIPILNVQISDLGTKETELEGYITALKGKKGEMREDLRLFKESKKDSGFDPNDSPNRSGNSIVSKVSKAESAFGRVLENSSEIAQGSGSLDHKNAAAMKELEDMAKKNRIQERLAAIKGNMEKGE